MVDKLNPVGPAALATQLSRVLQGRKSASAKQGQGNDPGHEVQGGVVQATLEQRIFRRVAAIDRDDPRRRQKAFRAFIEAQILNELGAELNNDAAFQQLVDDVVAAMEGA